MEAFKAEARGDAGAEAPSASTSRSRSRLLTRAHGGHAPATTGSPPTYARPPERVARDEARPFITRSEGVYLYDEAGKQYFDWTSEAVCSNLGYTLPPAVTGAINSQLATVPFVYGGLAGCEIRGRLSQLMAEIMEETVQVEMATANAELASVKNESSNLKQRLGEA